MVRTYRVRTVLNLPYTYPRYKLFRQLYSNDYTLTGHRIIAGNSLLLQLCHTLSVYELGRNGLIHVGAYKVYVIIFSIPNVWLLHNGNAEFGHQHRSYHVAPPPPPSLLYGQRGKTKKRKYLRLRKMRQKKSE